MARRKAPLARPRGQQNSPPPPANFANQTIWTHDNLYILRGLNTASVDLIYLDPPFNKNANYAAPIGSKAAGASFKDSWTLTDLDVAWIDLIERDYPGLYRVILAAMTDSDKSYLAYMAVRLIELQRVLKPTGSLWLHCDHTMSHHLKLVLDAVFGKRNFRNEVVWCYTGPGSPGQGQFPRKHDTLFWYSNSAEWTFNPDAVRIPHHGKTKANFKQGLQGSGFVADTYDLAEGGKVPESWWAQAKGNGLAIAARQAKQYVGYPTQKPLALLDRVILASSNPGEIVMDPFCGCATACIAAEQNHRKWVGIDISPKAAELVAQRMRDELGVFFQGIHRTDIPRRTDLGDLIAYNDPRNKRHLYGEQGGYCKGCGTHFELRNLEVDHKMPRSQGGTDHLSNLQLLCGHCNRVKGDRGMEYLKSKLQIAA